MPPWHIDKTVGIQKFKNDRSLSDEQIDTIVRWVDAGAPQGDQKDMPPAKTVAEDQGWNFAAIFGQKEPDMVINSYAFTMKAQHAGCVGQARRDRYHRAALGAGDRNPSEDAKGRRITHHAIAYLEQEDPNAPPALACRRPFMEWAVGKQGEMMRPDTGKLLLPGSKFHWDIHYSQAGEEITSNVELGIYFYPKGQEPKYRTTLQLVPAALGRWTSARTR